MTWAGYAAISMACWAMVQIVDKTLIETEAPSYRHYLFVSGLTSVPVVLVGPAVLGSVTDLPTRTLGLALAAGACNFAGTAFFFAALTFLDASVAAAALAAIPAGAAIVSWPVLGERLQALPALGLGLITIGVLTMNGPRGKGGDDSRRGKAWLAVIAAVMLYLAEYVIEGYAVGEVRSGIVFYWGRVGVVVATLALALARRGEAGDAIVWAVRRPAVAVFALGNEALNMVAIACMIEAYTRGPVGLATGIGYANPALVFLLTITLNRLRRGMIPSAGDAEHLAWRALGVAVVVAGVLLASLSASS